MRTAVQGCAPTRKQQPQAPHRGSLEVSKLPAASTGNEEVRKQETQYNASTPPLFLKVKSKLAYAQFWKHRSANKA